MAYPVYIPTHTIDIYTQNQSRIHFTIWYETLLSLRLHILNSWGTSSETFLITAWTLLDNTATPKSWLLIWDSPSKSREEMQYYLDILAKSLLHSFEKKRRICTAKYILFIFAVESLIMMIFKEILPGTYQISARALMKQKYRNPP